MINNKDIRSGVVSRLNGETNAGTNVFSARVNPLRSGSLPAISVFTTDVNAEGVKPSEPAFRRSLSIVLEVTVADSSTWQDDVDDIIYNIKSILFSDSTWVQQFSDISGYTEQHELSGEGEQPVAVGTLTIDVSIFEAETFN